MSIPEYIKWIIHEDGVIKEDDHVLRCFKIDYNQDEAILDEWALQLRRNYISDQELKDSCQELGMGIKEYITQKVIPQRSDKMGSMSRSNAFSEMLVADILEFVYSYNVPRYRFYNMSGKTVSEHGSDVIGYKLDNREQPSINDRLVVVEVKAVLSKPDTHVIISALSDSVKDYQRLGYSLDYMRRKLKLMNKNDEARDVLRFEKKTSDNMDYTVSFVAAGVTSLVDLQNDKNPGCERKVIPNIEKDDLVINMNSSIFFIHGKELMQLAHNLFDRCIK